MSNPGVQDCGAPAAYAIAGRSNERLPRPTDSTFTDEVEALRQQQPCSERVSSRMTWGVRSLVAFLVMAAVGAMLGILDDRGRLRRAPRFERLLRERPADAPGAVWDRPIVPEEDIGTTLPDVEATDVESFVVWSGATVCVLLIIGGISDTWSVITDAQVIALLLVVLLAVIARFIAAVDINVLERGLLPDGGTIDRALRIAVACDFVGRVRPAFGSAGVESHALVREGVPRSRVLVDVGSAFALGAIVHGLLLVFLFFAAVVAGSSGGAWPPRGFVLVLIVVGFFLAGVVWLPARVRRLPCTLGRVTIDRLRERWQRSPTDVAVMIGLAMCLPLVHGLVVISAVRAFGGSGSAISILFVVVLALAFGAFAPVPEGLVAADVVLVIGLSLAGVDGVVGVVAVLTWRLAMYWLPIVPGYLMTRRLLARGTL